MKRILTIIELLEQESQVLLWGGHSEVGKMPRLWLLQVSYSRANQALEELSSNHKMAQRDGQQLLQVGLPEEGEELGDKRKPQLCVRIKLRQLLQAETGMP